LLDPNYQQKIATAIGTAIEGFCEIQWQCQPASR
jgi:hypothetical protein